MLESWKVFLLLLVLLSLFKFLYVGMYVCMVNGYGFDNWMVLKM